ncbi:MAG: phenylacetate--CoA ligase family protein [Geminicoccaceae bacterium]
MAAPSFRALLATPGTMLRAPWLSPEQLAGLQWRRLRRLLDHAFATSPLWRERFAALGATPADLRSPADLTLLPVTRREELRAPDRLLAENLSRARLKTATTSGSTGRRTTSYFDGDAWYVGKHLLKLRARFACGMRPSDRVALFQEADAGRKSSRLGGRARTFSVHVPPERLIDEVAAFAPDVLYGFPGHLVQVGLAARGRLRPRLVFTSGELLAETTRRQIEALLGTRVYDVYGSTEVKEIAWECPERTGYHVNADWTVIETVPATDELGRTTNQILITSLANFAMPLIRYEIGDTGELLPGRCPCGRGLPLMRPTLGRSVDYLALADGTVITPYDMTCAIEHLPGMLRYQIVQRAVDRVEVLILPGEDYSSAVPDGIRLALRPILRGLDAEVRLVDEMRPEPSGKFRIVRSDLAHSAPAPADG